MFGVFAAMSTIPAFFSSADLGIGPALGHKLALGVVGDDRPLQARYFRAAFAVVVSVGILIAGLGAGFLLLGKADFIFGRPFAAHQVQLQQGCWIVLGIVAMQVIVSIGGKARAGFQEIHLNNIFGATGNLVTVLLLLIVAWLDPDLILIILVVYGVGLVAQCSNLIHLLVGRPYLLRSQVSNIWQDIRRLLTDSILYAVAIGLIGWQRELAKLSLGRSVGPVEVGHLAILLSLASMFGGLVIMVTAPVWPAIADARARSDALWLDVLWRKLNRLSTVFALLVGVLIGGGGGIAVRYLYGNSYDMPAQYFWLLGLYFLIFVLGHIRFTWLMGHNRMKQLALIAVLEFASNAACLWGFHNHLSIEFLLSILVANHFAFSVCLQEALRRRVLNFELPHNPQSDS
ncbi:hypothetical protein SAMN05444173_2963 [Opitutus sp. GAS368]|nr:hypothetical protein SAMN05444173_2963 [Opitutus sp. GAS368]